MDHFDSNVEQHLRSRFQSQLPKIGRGESIKRQQFPVKEHPIHIVETDIMSYTLAFALISVALAGNIDAKAAPKYNYW